MYEKRNGGIYTLIFSTDGCLVRPGALGEIPFQPGWYGYVGSALGPGGFSRVDRHIRLATSRDRNPRWHVDYLLTNALFILEKVCIAETTTRLECPVAKAMNGEEIPGFGSSDCSCRSHLFYWKKDPTEEILRAFSACGLVPRILPVC